MKKILVANRGEIALRVMRTAKDMGIKTVAVYSEPDRNSPHVKYADEAFCIGPAASSESYLRIDKILEVCKANAVDGIHPGYGFLSENPNFAREVEAAGLTLIGPGAHAMEVMGSKLAAKAAVKNYDIPMVPGTDDAIEDLEEAIKVAKGIGYPILIKASAGGGGKGMRVVEREEDLAEQMERAISEAKSSFGDGSVFVEKYVTKPRHIEIQVMADKHGNVVHFYERECSIQRRHQKVVEEAPSAVLTDEMRAEMGRAATDVARACNYVGAGTVEFLVDAELKFYFLEMNTRLQVEHPVTEMVTGFDLVREQIRVARGEELGYIQEEIPLRGHAVELRVYAEDPAQNFLPDTGTLVTYRRPHGVGVRVDDGFEEGMEIPIFYDPMISKLVAFGKDREEAIARMIRIIDDYHISGVKTTLPFGTFVMKHPAFVSGDFDTGFVGKYFTPESLIVENEEEEAVASILANAWLEMEQKSKVREVAAPNYSPWRNRS